MNDRKGISTPLLPRTLLLLDEAYTKDGHEYYSPSMWWRFARNLTPHCTTMTLYVPLREGRPPDGAFQTDVGSAQIVGRPYYRRIQEYYARRPVWHRRLTRQANDLMAAHDLVISRLPAPVTEYVARAAQANSKPMCLLVAGNVLTQSSWIVDRGTLTAWIGRRAAHFVRRREFSWAAQSAFVGVWGEELRSTFQDRCPNVHVCQSPNIEMKDLFQREDTCTGQVIRIVRVCQYWPHKAIDSLLRAAAVLVREGRNIVVDVVGPWLDRQYVDFLHRLREELNLGDRVNLHGPKAFGDELFSYYRRADIHVLTSRGEGIPRCIAEGRAFSLPTIATTVGGVPSVVEDGEDGLLIPPEDDEALAGALRRVIDDGALRRHLIARGFQRAKCSTAEYHAERLARLIADAIRYKPSLT